MTKQILKHSFFVIFLTVVSQVGGLIYLFCIPLFKFLRLQFKNKWVASLINSFSFLAVYCFVSWAIIPPIAKRFGRVPLPVYSSDNIKPLNVHLFIK